MICNLNTLYVIKYSNKILGCLSSIQVWNDCQVHPKLFISFYIIILEHGGDCSAFIFFSFCMFPCKSDKLLSHVTLMQPWAEAFCCFWFVVFFLFIWKTFSQDESPFRPLRMGLSIRMHRSTFLIPIPLPIGNDTNLIQKNSTELT